MGEYFDAPPATWVGQQSRTYQTWTDVWLLLCITLLPGQAPGRDGPQTLIAPPEPQLSLGEQTSA